MQIGNEVNVYSKTKHWFLQINIVIGIYHKIL
jgi:hypothetical protein